MPCSFCGKRISEGLAHKVNQITHVFHEKCFRSHLQLGLAESRQITCCCNSQITHINDQTVSEHQLMLNIYEAFFRPRNPRLAPQLPPVQTTQSHRLEWLAAVCAVVAIWIITANYAWGRQNA